MSETVISIHDFMSDSEAPICRICQEEFDDSCRNMETPCACSGTMKYAHRDCVQRWCYVKGNTTCEICLQEFEGGYKCYEIAGPRKTHQQYHTTVTIRESLGVAEQEQENVERDDVESASGFRSAALLLTVLLLGRHLLGVVIGGEGTCPFSLVSVIILKASGIILPISILIRISESLHKRIRHYRQISDELGV